MPYAVFKHATNERPVAAQQIGWRAIAPGEAVQAHEVKVENADLDGLTSEATWDGAKNKPTRPSPPVNPTGR